MIRIMLNEKSTAKVLQFTQQPQCASGFLLQWQDGICSWCAAAKGGLNSLETELLLTDDRMDASIFTMPKREMERDRTKGVRSWLIFRREDIGEHERC